MKGLLATTALALAMAGCEQPLPGGTSLFPLDEGREWRYAEQTASFGEVTRATRAVENLGEAMISPNDETPYRIRRWSHGVDYYLREDASGVYRKGLRTFIEDAPREDPDPRYVLRLPLREGTNWTQDTHPYLLWRTDQQSYDYKRIHTIQMTYYVVEQGTEVTVPAGVFTDAVLIEGEAALDIYTDPVKGVVTVPITSREWYAPGVGLVKAERIEELDTDNVKGGTWTLELMSYR